MCSRFTVSTKAKAKLQAAFPGVDVRNLHCGRYNIAPAQEVAVILDCAQDRIAYVRWGLVPRWSKDLAIGSRLINARAETLAEKTAFSEALARRRCVIVADGFFEWHKRSAGRRGEPHYFQLVDERPFAMAGLWETWEDPAGQKINSCAIITTEPNATVARVHDRMPVVLTTPRWEAWLAPGAAKTDLLRPCLAAELCEYRVSAFVNNPNNDGADCVAPERDLFDL